MMKLLYHFKLFIIAGLLITTTLPASAKIWPVNNNVGVNADFTSFATAVGSSSVLAGDTLHVESSATSYGQFGSINIFKRLVILGTGYFLDQNAKTQANKNPSVFTDGNLGRIYFDAAASGSVIMGMDIGELWIADASNLVISRNTIRMLFLNIQGAPGVSNNILITGNYFYRGPNSSDQSGITFYYGAADVQYNNLRIENNIIVERLQVPFITSGQIINNYIGDNFSASNCLIKNNYMTYAGGAGSNVVQYNIFRNSNAALAGVDGNFVADASTVFNGDAIGQDAGFQLRASSPAINAGRDAANNPVNIGPFGGASPYVLSGMPSIPSIYSLSVPQNVPNGTTTMTVTLSTISRD